MTCLVFAAALTAVNFVECPKCDKRMFGERPVEEAVGALSGLPLRRGLQKYARNVTRVAAPIWACAAGAI